MPSPDLTAYNPLVLLDRNAADIVDAALADAAVKLPGWIPREGNTELALLEVLALPVQELIFAVNRLPNGVVEVLLRLLGIVRSLGNPPDTSVTFTVSDSLGHVLGAGTRVRLDPGTGADSIDFLTDAALAIPVGSTDGTVTATATTSTDAFNGIPAGTALAVIDPIPFVETAALAAVISGGTGVEADDAWRARAVTKFTRLTSTLILPEHFTAAALDHPTVYRAFTIDQWDPTLAGGAGGAANGHVTVAVLGPDGLFVSPADKADLLADLNAESHAGLGVHVIDPTITDVDVTATVKAFPGQTLADVEAACVAALTDYLSPTGWTWSGTVRVNELIALLSNVAGVDYVVTVTTPAADLPIAGAAPLAAPGALDVTAT